MVEPHRGGAMGASVPVFKQPLEAASKDRGFSHFLTQSQDHGDQRWRDLFPMSRFSHPGVPSQKLSKSVRQRIHHSGRWVSWANSGIDALNSMFGFTDPLVCPADGATLNAAQAKARSHIQTAYADACANNDMCTSPEESLSALLSTSGLYNSDTSAVVPYSKELCSWPQIGSKPTPLSSILSPADVSYCQDGCEPLLRPTAAAQSLRKELDLRQPYSDPSLVKNPKVYADFLRRLGQAGMVRWSERGARENSVGVFFVRKSNGKIRIVFDTRVANTCFVEPPSTRLPTSAAFAGVSSEAPETFMCTGDIECAFYNMATPDSLSQYFTLPKIKARHLGTTQINGIAISPETEILPELLVLPMGWSWSLHMCQSVLNHALVRASFPASRQISDGSVSAVIVQPDGNISAGYVDNFAVLGADRALVKQKRDAICNVLRDEMGLPVHELSGAEPAGTFIGLQFSGGRVFRVRDSRMHRLRSAIQCVLRRGRASGDVIRILVGHITFACLLRREALSFIHSLYAFAQKNLGRVARLWPSVRRELECISAVLPLLRVDISQPWSVHVSASDASLFGLGGCEKVVDPGVVRAVGRVSERWRYAVDAFVSARTSAFQDGGPGPHMDIEPKVLEDLKCAVHDATSDFAEVPPEIYESDGWRTFYAARVKNGRDILLLEARALVASLKHQLRRSDNFNKQLLFIVDNLALCLAACKGRSSAAPLLHALRQIACLLLASGSRGGFRWVPSERNYSDHASRGAFGFWSSLPSRYAPESKPQPPPRPVRECGGSDGILTPICSSSEALSRALSCSRPVVARQRNSRSSSHHFLRVPVRGGFQCGDGSQDYVGSWPFPPRDGGGRHSPSASSQASPFGMEESPPTVDATANASIRGSDSGSEACSDRKSCHGGVGDALLCMLPAAERMPPAEGSEPYSPGARLLRSMGNHSQRHVLGGGRQNRDFRRVDSHSRCVALPNPKRIQSNVTPGRMPLEVLHELPPPDIPCHLSAHSPERLRGAPLLVEARWSQPRSYDRGVNSSCAAPRQVGISEVPSPICQGDPSFRSHGEAQPSATGSCPKSGTTFSSRSERRARALHPFSSRVTPPNRPSSAAKSCADVKAPSAKQRKSDEVRRLKREFQKVRRSGRNSRTRIVLELFSGSERMSKKLRDLGWGVLSIDILNGEHHNILRPDIFRLLLSWISSGAIAAIWIATPCSSWSAALHGPPGSSWCALRSKHHIYGLPGLDARCRERCRIGNCLMRRTAAVLSRARSLVVPCFVENPVTSMLWQAPPIAKIIETGETLSTTYDACGYGARWRKRTRIISVHAPPRPQLCKLCAGRKGVCSFTGLPHIVLSGVDPSSKRLWTKIAEPYPVRMCSAFAQHISNSVVRLVRNSYEHVCS